MGKKNLSWDSLNNNCHVNDSIFFSPITQDEIEKHILQIKPISSFYEYNITNFILKNTARSISYPLMLLFNMSLSTGIYSTCLKKCIVIPIFKSGDKLNCCNYRPISLSLSLSNIFEKSIKSRIINFLQANSFFSDYQFGFLQGRSVNDENFFVNKYIHENLDLNNKTMGIFLDVKKAFDSLNHDSDYLLLKKLHYSGIRGI